MFLNVSVSKKNDGIVTISLIGSLDTKTHAILEKELDPILKEKPDMIVYDLADLKYISSIGLRLIFKTKKSLKDHNGRMALVNLQPQIKDVFNIVKALPAEQIFESVEELDNYLLSMQNRRIEEG